jgi:hypothetical protein
VDQGQFSDPDFISGTHQRENVQMLKNVCFRDKAKGNFFSVFPANILEKSGRQFFFFFFLNFFLTTNVLVDYTI